MERIKKTSLSMLTLILIFSMLMVFPLPATADQGPKTDDLVIYFCSSVEAAYAMLKMGEADICGYELTRTLYEDAITDPNILLAPVADFGMVQFDINSNCTIPTYPGVRSPTNYREFRQAMALLVDKETIIDDCCGGLATQIDQPIAAPSSGWMNESYMGANYPYIYNPASAAAKLDAGGFVEGTTVNPHYDSGFPGSTAYLRVYPVGHEKAGQDLDPLVCCVRNDDLRRFCAGRMLYENLRKLGVPCNVFAGPMVNLYDKVMGEFDYHFYTSRWSVGRFATYVYYLYHSDSYYPYGTNYVTGYDCAGNPNYPDLDDLLYDVYHCESFSMSLGNCKNAMGLFTEYCITIPLWSSLSYWAYLVYPSYSMDVLSLVNMKGVGLDNDYSFMNAYKPDGTPLRYVLKSPPTSLNVLYSSWFYDRQVLDRMNVYGGLDVAPYELARDQAGFIQDWHVGTWDDDGTTKSKLTYWLRKDANFAEPVTGNLEEHLNATSWLMSAFIQYALQLSWFHSEYYDVHHFVALDDYCIEVYYDSESYWHTYACAGPMLPPRVWLQPPLSTYEDETFPSFDSPGIALLSSDIAWIDEVTYDDMPLTMFTDYNWIQGKLHVLADLPSGTLRVKYWRVGGAVGFYPGGVPWQTSLEGAGMYYVTDIVVGVGGYATLKRNPYYWMETPPSGEIDFYWVWGTLDESRRVDANRCPRTGWYYVDMADTDYARLAYGSQGRAVPDEYWFPGADLAPFGAYIDLRDVLSILCNWKMKHSITP